MNQTIQQIKLLSGAKIFIYNLDKTRIHTYVAPENSFGDATHIIETANYLSIIDTQYMIPYSNEFREYANSLNKTIAGVIISHSHPDHYFGLTTAFNDVLSYALPETISEIKSRGPVVLQDLKTELGDLLPDHITVPNTILYTGDVIIDGLALRYIKYKNAEADTQIVIELPDLKTIIVQDTIYNRYHPWIGKNIDNWINLLHNIKDDTKNYQLILTGHGNPASIGAFDRMIRYLKDVKNIISEYNGDKKMIEQQIINSYPDYKGRHIIPMWLNHFEF